MSQPDQVANAAFPLGRRTKESGLPALHVSPSEVKQLTPSQTCVSQDVGRRERPARRLRLSGSR